MPITDPVFATHLLAIVLVVACILSLRNRKSIGLSVDAVQEVKGFAILAVVFSHIGYFLVSDHRFLSPLSAIAGVGVDLFLLVSGFGLAMSMLKNPKAPIEFYRRRLDKLFVPLWIVLAVLFIADFFVLHKTYPIHSTVLSFLGWFPTADIYTDINSPLWYITLILFFYVIFPVLFSPRRPLFSAALMCTVAYMGHHMTRSLLWGVADLHALHLYAFPIGVALASLVARKQIPTILNPFARTSLLVLLVAAVGYAALHQNIGTSVWIAQGTSIMTALMVLGIFALKPYNIAVLSLCGLYSYEIYLVHWPVMYRYDVFFAIFPAWLAVVAYLVLFICIGRVFRFIPYVWHNGRAWHPSKT